MLVDDYELRAGPDGPLAALLPFLPQGHDIGFHLVLARSPLSGHHLSREPVGPDGPAAVRLPFPGA